MLRDTKIAETAIIDPKAKIGQGVHIGHYSVIGPNVSLGDEVTVGSHAQVEGKTQIGAKSIIYHHATLGTTPQDLKYNGEETELICGKENTFREYSNFSIGTVEGGGKTIVGDKNLFMVNTHIAHDCKVGNQCIFANSVSLAGHVELGDRAVLGGHVAVHQFVKIGNIAMVGGGSIVVQDITPFTLVQGNHAKAVGINRVGLRRAGYNVTQIAQIKDMFKDIYYRKLTIEEALKSLKEKFPKNKESDSLISFIKNSKRGLCR